jgi:hypothetical protein
MEHKVEALQILQGLLSRKDPVPYEIWHIPQFRTLLFDREERDIIQLKF